MTPDALLLSAIEELAGCAALMLDRKLRVVFATPRAIELLGEIPPMISAPRFLCGDAAKRPVAEALAAGKAVTATVPRPARGRERLLRISTVPIHGGWVLLIDERPIEGSGPELFHGMWSNDPAMRRVFRIVEKVARAEASVLVRGETGSGKELVAAALHQLSPRKKGPFRAINCAAVPPALLESELFGHVRGAFTGAVRDTPGHFKLADRGTLFLDEVAELPLELQAKLLRVLETHAVTPVGGRDAIAVDVRIVAATHRALRKEVEAGRFRTDLMYRLRVIPIFIPPLRDRQGDALLLAERFIEEMNERGGRRIARISRGAEEALAHYDWPGNVRELRNVLEYAFAIGESPLLLPSDLPPELVTGSSMGETNVPPPLPAASPEAQKILRALERAGHSRERAAKILGISRVTLWRRMKELGLEQQAAPV